MKDQILSYVVRPEDHYTYLREILISRMQLSHALLTKLKLQQKIKVNGQAAHTNYRLQLGDVITIDISLAEESPIVPQNIPLDIIYEDADLLLINKAPDMAVHPVKKIPEGTLANAVTYYWMKQGHSLLFRPINRLDKDTSGLIIIGKSKYAHQAMFRQQQQGTIHRSYQAVVEGRIDADYGTINQPIARIDLISSKRAVAPDGKPAVTHFVVLQRYEGFTLLSLTLETGRTHQIRVHLSESGHPICGDALYGSPSPLINRQALHAGRLTFHQPRTGDPLEFEAPLPLDMTTLVKNLRPLG